MRSGGESACVRAVLLKSDGIRVSARSECGRYADLANGDGVSESGSGDVESA